MFSQKTISVLKDGGVGVIPTDTLYGLVGYAFITSAIERIFRLKGRSGRKPVIVLIADVSDLEKFGIDLNERQREILDKIWPNSVSVIFECRDKRFDYIHRGSDGIAFRLPAQSTLRDFLRETGPLAAPSANREGAAPARTVGEAKA